MAAGTMGAKATQRGAQKKRVMVEKSRNNKSDPQKAEGGTRLSLLETITPRIMDETKKKAVSAKGTRNIVQWAREIFLGLVSADPRPPQARHVP